MLLQQHQKHQQLPHSALLMSLLIEKVLIIYKLPESNNHSNDKTNVAKLCKAVFDIDVGITKSMRLGKKSEDKIRPLLIFLDSQQNAVYITSYASYLRRHEEYNNVYIAPDITKYQKHKHKQLVDELKHRRSNSENNIVIRNGEIITKRVYISNARNHDTRAPHMETTNTDPPTMTPVAAHMDNTPTHPYILWIAQLNPPDDGSFPDYTPN